MLWYDKNNLKIDFDVVPEPEERFVIPEMSQEEIDDIYKFPYILNNDLKVAITYQNNNYNFEIKKGFKWDGATIPQAVWSIIGADTDNHFLIASLIHDVLCENHGYINNNRKLSTMIFCALLEEAQVPTEKRDVMFEAVDNFQKVKGKWGNECLKN